MAASESPYTMTPGSAVADQLQDILTRKRLEARQNMLDKFDMNYKQQQMDSLAEERTQRANEYKALQNYRNAQADKDWLSGLGDNPNAIDQSTYERGAKLAPGLFSKETEQGPLVNPQTTYKYLGSQKYQQAQKAINGLQQLASDPAWATMSPEQKYLRFAQNFPMSANPDASFERLLTSKGDQNRQVYGLDMASGRLVDLATHRPVDPAIAAKVTKDQVIPISRPPRDPQDRTQPLFSGTGDPWVFDPAKGVFRHGKVEPDPNTPPPPAPAGAGNGPAPPPALAANPPTPAAPASPVLPQLYRPGQTPPPPTPDYDAKALAEFQKAFGRSGSNTQLRGQRESAEEAFLNSIHDPSARADIQAIRHNKVARMLPVDKAMAYVQPPPELKDAKAQQEYLARVRNVLSLLPNYKRQIDEQ